MPKSLASTEPWGNSVQGLKIWASPTTPCYGSPVITARKESRLVLQEGSAEPRAPLWEGGVRVPGIIEWPTVIKQHRITSFPRFHLRHLPNCSRNRRREAGPSGTHSMASPYCQSFSTGMQTTMQKQIENRSVSGSTREEASALQAPSCSRRNATNNSAKAEATAPPARTAASQMTEKFQRNEHPGTCNLGRWQLEAAPHPQRENSRSVHLGNFINSRLTPPEKINVTSNHPDRTEAMKKTTPQMAIQSHRQPERSRLLTQMFDEGRRPYLGSMDIPLERFFTRGPVAGEPECVGTRMESLAVARIRRLTALGSTESVLNCPNERAIESGLSTAWTGLRDDKDLFDLLFYPLVPMRVLCLIVSCKFDLPY